MGKSGFSADEISVAIRVLTESVARDSKLYSNAELSRLDRAAMGLLVAVNRRRDTAAIREAATKEGTND